MYSKEVSNAYRTLSLIWIVMFVSLFIYLFMGLFISKSMNIKGMENNVTEMFREALYAISIITLIGTKYIKSFIIKSNIKTRSKLQTLSESNIAKYTTALLVSMALTESVGIYGLVLYIFSGNKIDLYLLFSISAFAMLFYRPNQEEMEKLINNNQKENNF